MFSPVIDRELYGALVFAVICLTFYFALLMLWLWHDERRKRAAQKPPAVPTPKVEQRLTPSVTFGHCIRRP